jgi:ribosomal protein S7
MFIRKGKKKLVINQINKALIMFKYEFSETPLLFYLEILEKLKPTFRLRKYIVRRTTIKEYPFIARHSRRYMTAVR